MVIYTLESGKYFANFNLRKKVIWNKRWIRGIMDIAYPISITTSHCKVVGQRYIYPDSELTLTVIPDEGYHLGSTIGLVTGATSSFDSVTGTITLSEASGTVSFSVSCIKDAAKYTVSFDVKGAADPLPTVSLVDSVDEETVYARLVEGQSSVDIEAEWLHNRELMIKSSSTCTAAELTLAGDIICLSDNPITAAKPSDTFIVQINAVGAIEIVINQVQ